MGKRAAYQPLIFFVTFALNKLTLLQGSGRAFNLGAGPGPNGYVQATYTYFRLRSKRVRYHTSNEDPRREDRPYLDKD